VYTEGKYTFLITPGVIGFFLACGCVCCCLEMKYIRSEAEDSARVEREANAENVQRRNARVRIEYPNVGTSAATSNYNVGFSATATSNDNVGVSSGFDDERFTQRRNRIDKMLLYKVRLDNVPPTKSRCNTFRVLTNILYSFPPFNIQLQQKVVECTSQTRKSQPYDMKESFRTNHPKSDLAIRRTGDGSDKYSWIKSTRKSLDSPSIREAHPLEEQNSAENESSTSVRLCTICLDDYKVGDEIGWSRNPDCHHVFHTHCVVEWLMTHTECPICRNSYVVDEEFHNPFRE
jgi:hypothetical protein